MYLDIYSLIVGLVGLSKGWKFIEFKTIVDFKKENGKHFCTMDDLPKHFCLLFFPFFFFFFINCNN